MRPSTKIALGFAVLCALGISGYHYWAHWQLQTQGPVGVRPGRVNFVGLLPSSGYRPILSNQVAHLVPEDTRGTPTLFGMPQNGIPSKKLPIDLVLQAFAGNPQALGRLASYLCNTHEPTPLSTGNTWSIQDIRKALSGEEPLLSQLQSSLNTKLNGMPLPSLNRPTIDEGILLKLPLRVQLPFSSKVLEGYYLEPFRSHCIRKFEEKLQSELSLDQKRLKKIYHACTQHPHPHPTLEQELLEQINPSRYQCISQSIQETLKKFVILLNEDHILSAHTINYKTQTNQTLCKLVFKLHEQARLRLWKFSRENPHSHILLTVDGIIIATPLIKGELSSDEVAITTFAETSLLKKVMEIIEKKTIKGKKSFKNETQAPIKF